MQECARLGESELGTELMWDARCSGTLEAKVLGEQDIDRRGIVLARK